MLRKINNKWLQITLAGALLFPLGTACAATKSNPNMKKVVIAQNTEVARSNEEVREVAVKKIAATNTPVKPVEKPPVRLVKLEVQRGEEISRLMADVDGDGKEELVMLMGNKIADSTHYKSDLYVVAKDPTTGKVKGFVRPQNLGGYDAYMTVCDVTGDDNCNIIVAAPTGGSGGIVDYRILDFGGATPREIFGTNENKGVSVTGSFLPDFKVRIVIPSINKEFSMDLPGDHASYIRLNVYEEDGSLKDSGLRPYTQDLVNLIALDVNGDGRDELITTQRVVGVLNSDVLGHVRTKWEYRAGSWQSSKVDFQTTLEAKQDFVKEDSQSGKGGYEIKKEQVEVDGSSIAYPHFSKLPKEQQWIVNKQVEDYAKTILRTVMGKGQATVRYNVKYAGNKFASIFFLGTVVKENKVDTVAEAFNFNLTTGEDLSLKKIVGSEGEFWQMIKAKSGKKNMVVNKNNVYSYYFDGDALVLLYGEGKEFELNASDLTKLLRKGEIKDEISTKQSKEDKAKKIERNKVNTEKTH